MRVHLYMYFFSINVYSIINVVSFSYVCLNNIFFSIVCFIVRIQYITHIKYKICVCYDNMVCV